MQGKIIKGVGGQYEVWSMEDHQVYTCQAKGIFRYQKEKPLIGDYVTLELVTDVTQANRANIVSILPRKSELIRPRVANIDQACLIMACQYPDPNLNLLDRFLVMLRKMDIPVILCFNKVDLLCDEETINRYKYIYGKSGCKIVFVSAKDQVGMEEVKNLLHGKTTVLAGPSGVGKSSFLNAIYQGPKRETGELSAKIARGKHTTRHTELLQIDEETYVCDTPGFSSLVLTDLSEDELRDYYPEFDEFTDDCKFLGCRHYGEKECGIKKAVLADKLPRERYRNYRLIYEELKAQRKY